MRRARRAAFSLIELLVVIGIIAVLIGIMLPTLAAVRKNAQAIQFQAMWSPIDREID